MHRLLWVFFLLVPLLMAAHKPTLVFNTTGRPPLNTENGSGFMDRVTELALSRIGYNLNLIQLPAERGLVNVNTGLDDAEMSRIAGLDKVYTNLRQVPEKIMDWEFVVFTKKELNLDNGWEALADKQVAFINGWKILENNVPASAKVVKVRNEQVLFNLLADDRTDYIIYEKWGGLEIIHQQNLSGINVYAPCSERNVYLSE
jgi:polar amino acid transport system substrate-binding protein